MFSKIGTGELLLILAIALIILGPSKLPKMAKSIGKALGNAKKYMRDITEEIEEVSDDVKDVQKDIADLGKDIKDPLNTKKQAAAIAPAAEATEAEQVPEAPAKEEPPKPMEHENETVPVTEPA